MRVRTARLRGNFGTLRGSRTDVATIDWYIRATGSRASGVLVCPWHLGCMHEASNIALMIGHYDYFWHAFNVYCHHCCIYCSASFLLRELTTVTVDR